MWLHEKYARESFAVDAKLIGGFFYFWCGVGLFKPTGANKLLCFRTAQQEWEKYTSCGYRGERPQIRYKTKQGGRHFVRLMVEISKQQRHGHTNCQGKILLPQRQRWSRERGNLGIHARWTVFVRVNLSCLEGKSTVLPWGTGLWRNITCCEQCRWGCRQGTMWQTGTNQSSSSLCICNGGWVITIHHQPDCCVNSGDSCFRERGQLLMPFNSWKWKKKGLSR